MEDLITVLLYFPRSCYCHCNGHILQVVILWHLILLHILMTNQEQWIKQSAIMDFFLIFFFY